MRFWIFENFKLYESSQFLVKKSRNLIHAKFYGENATLSVPRDKYTRTQKDSYNRLNGASTLFVRVQKAGSTLRTRGAYIVLVINKGQRNANLKK